MQTPKSSTMLHHLPSSSSFCILSASFNLFAKSLTFILSFNGRGYAPPLSTFASFPAEGGSPTAVDPVVPVAVSTSVELGGGEKVGNLSDEVGLATGPSPGLRPGH